MSLSQSEAVLVKCVGCSRQVRVPSGKVRFHLRTRPEQVYVVFCSSKCQNTFIAKTGAKQQEELLSGHA